MTNARRNITYITLLTLCVISLVPLLWAVVTSLKPNSLIVAFPPEWVPKRLTMEHYRQVLFMGSFASGNFARAIVNSFLVSIAAAIGTLVISILAAYSTARIRPPGTNVFLILILSTTMIPGISILVPLYIFSNTLGIYDTYFALVLTHTAWRIPFTVWLLYGFFKNIPKEIEESALLDGCGQLRAFLAVSLPLVKPGLAAAAILIIVYVWQDFLIGFTLVLSQSKRVATVALYSYLSQFGVQWGELMAATIVAILPVLILFLLLQRQFIHGLTGGAIK